jgi:electron transfer flavoprotein beta subunit
VKIAVCVKAVPAAGARLDPATLRLDRSGDLAISEYDTHAIEEALRLRERGDPGDGEVVIVSQGPERAAEALRKALAMGADRTVLVTDPALEGSDLLATSKALAAALALERADLVLLGQQSADGNGACLGAALAERLALPVLSQVAELTIDGGAATGKRQTEAGYETIRAPLPALVTVSEAINEPRYPSLKGIMGAKSKPQDTLSAAEVGGAETSGTTVLAIAPPPARGERQRVEDDGNGNAAQAIVDFLVEQRLL